MGRAQKTVAIFFCFATSQNRKIRLCFCDSKRKINRKSNLLMKGWNFFTQRREIEDIRGHIVDLASLFNG